MGRRVLNLAIFLIILTPSVQYVWQGRDMPQFAYLHDDGILFVTAKSVAAGSYRIESFPDAPSQTKFPPLYPAYLSLVWKLNPNFPDNLAMGSVFSWIPLVAYLFLARMLYRKMGIPEGRAWLLTGLLGLNPYLLAFGGMMFSDIFFSCWVLAAMLALMEESFAMAAVAGALAACAYLSRTAGVALLVSVPVAMIWDRRKASIRKTAIFAAPVVAAVAVWTLWTRAHSVRPADLTTLYYTDYMRYLLRFDWKVLPVIVWKNVDQLLYSAGSMIVPRAFDVFFLKNLTQLVAVAMIAGTVRLVRRGSARQYACFAVVTSGIFLIWNFPPTERFLIPMYPLLLAGLMTEIEHLGTVLISALRKKNTGERVIASGFLAAVALLLSMGLLLQIYMAFVYPRQTSESRESKLKDQRAAYQWIVNNVPASANVLSYDDPLLYLYTTRRGNYLPLDPVWWYTEDHDSIRASYRNLAEYCRRRGLQYVYFTSEDLSRETGDEDRAAVQRAVRENPELSAVFQAGIGTVYRVGAAAR